MSENVAIFIRAKLSSTRLPRKHLLQVLGKPIIEHLIHRIRCHTNIRTVVLCTTDEDTDDELVEIAKSQGIYYHRWKKGDVLRQYVDAAHKFNIKNIVNIDADDPLVDYNLIDQTAAFLDATGADYITWKGYPLGCTPSGMSVAGLRLVASKHEEDIEHVFAYLEQESTPVKLEIKKSNKILSKPYLKNIRLTLDYPEDYELFKIIYDNIYSPITNIDFKELMRFIDTHQHLIWINNFRNAEFRENQQAELQKSRKPAQEKPGIQPTDEQILEAYSAIRKRQHKTFYVSTEELFIQLRIKNHISLDDFKAGMLRFFDNHNMKDFEFSVGSGSRKECNRYGFLAGGKLMYYMQKLQRRIA